MKQSKVLLACVCFLLLAATGARTASAASAGPEPNSRRTGSEFARYAATLDTGGREHAILNEILAGNLPSFLRNLVPVKLDYHSLSGKSLSATVFVMPEYLAIGSDRDFLRIPMNLHTASAVASRLGYVLPTRKIVDAIYQQAAFHFSPEPMTAGPQMRSTEYYLTHNGKIEVQAKALGVVPGSLVSGDKKDVVLSPRITNNPLQLAIYGWHRLNGAPIQTLSTVHGACYADYSHGIRLVSEMALVNGERRSIYDLLADPELAGLVSDEGPIRNLRGFVEQEAVATCDRPPAGPTFSAQRIQPTFFTQRNPR